MKARPGAPLGAMLSPLLPLLGPLSAVAAVVVVAGLGWRPVFEGWGFAVPIGVTAFLATVLVAVLARSSLPAVARVAIWTVALVVVAGLAAERDTLLAVLPTPGTVGAVLAGVRDGWAQILTVTLPVKATGPPLVTAIVATWLAGSLAAALVIRTRAVMVPLLPPLVAFALSLLLGAGGRPAPRAVAVALAVVAGAYLLARTGAATRHDPRRWILGAATVLVAVLITVTVASSLPGAGRDRFDVRRLRDQPVLARPQVNPMATITAEVVGPDRVLFTARLESPTQPTLPAPWRVTSLERFDKRQWTSDDTFRRIGAALLPPELEVPADEVRQRVTLVDYQGSLLPAVERPSRVSPAGLAADGAGNLAVPGDGAARPSTYEVVSSVSRFDPTSLRSAAAEAAVPALELPSDIEAQVSGITEGASSAFGKMAALQGFFRSGGFVYDNGPEAPSGHGLFQIKQLLERRRGTAEQYASAFAVMARNLGYRSRVAVGYLPGRLDLASGSVVVSAHDAHAWPEILFEGVGWVPFEPSPLERRTVPAEGAQPAEPAPEPVATAVSSEVEAQARDRKGEGPQGQQPRPAPKGKSPAAVAAVIAVMLFAIWGLVGVALGAVAAMKERRRRRRRQGPPAVRIAGAWQEAMDRLVEAGVDVKPDMTGSDLARAPRVPAPAKTALAGLVTIANQARFGGVAPGEGDAEEAWRSAERVGMGVRVGRSRSVRLRMAVNPAPLVRTRQRAGTGS